MNKYICYREAQIERVKDELNRRLSESDNSIEITMKSGKKFLVGKQAENYQLYYIGDISGDIDCDLVAEVYSDYDLAKFIMTL